MKKYYYSEEDKQIGPLTFEELKDKKISKETMVWYEGLDNWTKANELNELKDFFKSIPPPLNINKQTPPPIPKTPTHEPDNTPTDKPKKSKKKLVIGAIAAIAIIIISSLFISQSSNRSHNTYDTNSGVSAEPDTYQEGEINTPAPQKQKTAEELREELYEREKKSPEDYLSTNYKLNYKVLSGKDEIIGKIFNTATMATFKNIELTVTCSTNTDVELSRKNYFLYDFVYPGSSKPFNLKISSPSGTKKIGVYIASATGE